MTAYVGGSSGFGPPSWATAGRPSSPVVGQMGWNSTLSQLEFWTGSNWDTIVPTSVSASTTNTVTNKVPFNINGTTYYLLASTSSA